MNLMIVNQTDELFLQLTRILLYKRKLFCRVLSLSSLTTRNAFLKMSEKYSCKTLLAVMISNQDSRVAAKTFSVLASTICEHRRNPPLHYRVSRSSYLSLDQEAYFFSLLKLLRKYGFDAAKHLTLQLATEYFQ